jgi:hypothetical protein
VFVSVFILVFSCAALVYWARYSCLTIMRAGSVYEEAERVAVANQLEFQKIRAQLEQSAVAYDPAAYDRLRDALRHDFLALTYLLRYAATIEVGRYSREERMLIVDFHIMRLVYRLGKMFGPRASRYALLEMSGVLEYFASVMNRRMLAFSANMLGA